MKLALFSAGSGAKTKQAARRWRVHLPLVRPLAFLLLPLALRASPVTTVDQLTADFCGQPGVVGCEDYPVLPPQLPPIPEAPGYTLGPYVGMLTLYGQPVSYYSGTILQFLTAEGEGGDENLEIDDGYAILTVYAPVVGPVQGGYLFTMTASPQLVSSITNPVPEPSSIVFVPLGVALIGARHLWSGCKTRYCSNPTLLRRS